MAFSIYEIFILKHFHSKKNITHNLFWRVVIVWKKYLSAEGNCYNLKTVEKMEENCYTSECTEKKEEMVILDENIIYQKNQRCGSRFSKIYEKDAENKY